MISRRAVLGGGLASLGTMSSPTLAAASRAPLADAPRSVRRRLGDPFTLGVASGDPDPDGMVLWTRLAPAPLAPDGGMPSAAISVRWEVSGDETFRDTRNGTVLARSEDAHAVHVEMAGLEPNRPYWYRFIAGGEVSPVGRTRTAPAPGRAVGRLRICYGSCQNYESGFWSAWRHAVADDPDRLPAPLHPYFGASWRELKWRWMGPGMHYIRTIGPSGGTMLMLRIGPGRRMPVHGHHGSELTQIVRGAYEDALGQFAAGDVADLDADTEHQPVTSAGEACICVSALDAPLRFPGWFARRLQPLFGI